MEQYKPLKGVKVVELSLMVASASCGRYRSEDSGNGILCEPEVRARGRFPDL